MDEEAWTIDLDKMDADRFAEAAVSGGGVAEGVADDGGAAVAAVTRRSAADAVGGTDRDGGSHWQGQCVAVACGDGDGAGGGAGDGEGGGAGAGQREGGLDEGGVGGCASVRDVVRAFVRWTYSRRCIVKGCDEPHFGYGNTAVNRFVLHVRSKHPGVNNVVARVTDFPMAGLWKVGPGAKKERRAAMLASAVAELAKLVDWDGNDGCPVKGCVVRPMLNGVSPVLHCLQYHSELFETFHMIHEKQNAAAPPKRPAVRPPPAAKRRRVETPTAAKSQQPTSEVVITPHDDEATADDLGLGQATLVDALVKQYGYARDQVAHAVSLAEGKLELAVGILVAQLGPRAPSSSMADAVSAVVDDSDGGSSSGGDGDAGAIRPSESGTGFDVYVDVGGTATLIGTFPKMAAARRAHDQISDILSSGEPHVASSHAVYQPLLPELPAFPQPDEALVATFRKATTEAEDSESAKRPSHAAALVAGLTARKVADLFLN